MTQDYVVANLLQFLGFEEHNLLASLHTCHADMNVFSVLDSIYQKPVGLVNIKVADKNNLTAAEKHKTAILSLYLFVHYHMYSAVATYMRCHLSDSLSQTTKAIDASFTAARLMRHPDTLEGYFSSDWVYKNIKKHVSKANEKTETEYPHTGPLVKMHELCSQFGAHADFDSFIHRLEITEEDEQGKSMLKIHMFQNQADLEFRQGLLRITLAFVQMLWIFADYLAAAAEGLDKAKWLEAIKQIGGAMFKESERIEQEIAKATEASQTR